jgi:catechol 2,3-dioxygenase-like lactoylglutathione lyase family enzyme
MPDTALTAGAHQIGITVLDIGATRAFFVDALGFDEVGGRPEYPSVFVSDGTLMITIWQATDPAAAIAFDRKSNIGLHHLALKVAPDALDGVHDKVVAASGVQVEFAPEPVGAAGARHMMCTIPGGVRIEFIGA